MKENRVGFSHAKKLIFPAWYQKPYRVLFFFPFPSRKYLSIVQLLILYDCSFTVLVFFYRTSNFPLIKNVEQQGNTEKTKDDAEFCEMMGWSIT